MATKTNLTHRALQMAKVISRNRLHVTGARHTGLAAGGLSIRLCGSDDVDYVHIWFDHHQVIFPDGLATEDSLPGPQARSSLEQAILDGMGAIFPVLNPRPRAGDGVSAPPAIRRSV